jgi:tetratricopeptide (TPR) repeat protein
VTQGPETDYRLIRQFECKVDGQTMSFEKALALLIEQARGKPENGLGWFRVANLLSSVNRPTATEEAFRHAISASPNAADIRLRFAQYLVSSEKREEAFAELRHVIQDPAGAFMISPQPGLGREFADLYNQLRRQLGRVDLPVVHPSALDFARAQGRNDPCACGSGKKFKRCCGQ